jgi:oxygen-independent coproporphyrinogen-3 oxidase
VWKSGPRPYTRRINPALRQFTSAEETPSLLPVDVLARILDGLRERFPLSPDVEVTLEANPGTVDRAYLRTVRELGVNRLSLGVQSVHEDELRLLGRIHSWEDAVGAVEAARAAGLENVNLDLIYGLPGQTLARWQETLDAALSLEPDHLSLYALTLEEGTPLQERVARGNSPRPTTTRRRRCTSGPRPAWRGPGTSTTNSPTGPGLSGISAATT